jgi:hypothetical protein
MRAASLFALAQARKAQIAILAVVSNSVDHVVADFDTGGDEYTVAVALLSAIAAPHAPSSRRQAD